MTWRRVVAIVSIVVAGGCAYQRVGVPGAPQGDAIPDLIRPLDMYRSLGFFTGDDRFPVVGSYSVFASTGDSAVVMVSFSLPYSALAFRRGGLQETPGETGYLAGYTVTLSVEGDGAKPIGVTSESNQTVRVATFEESKKSAESVIYQTFRKVPAGTVTIRLQVRDRFSTHTYEGSRKLTISPARVGRISTPTVVNSGNGRNAIGDVPDLIANPRSTVSYGRDSALVYIEGYGFKTAPSGTLTVIDPETGPQFSTAVTLDQGTTDVRWALVRIPLDSIVAGVLRTDFKSKGGDSAVSGMLLVSFSNAWVVSNWEQAIGYLRYLATPREMASLRDAPPRQRAERWDAFWKVRDPIPMTPENEFEDQYFDRIRIANIEYDEPASPGWMTDRGEVFITIGAPSLQQKQPAGQTPQATEVWTYDDASGGQLVLAFYDRDGIGRFILTPDSRALFRAYKTRIGQ